MDAVPLQEPKSYQKGDDMKGKEKRGKAGHRDGRFWKVPTSPWAF
jgi:hypothetical protein